MMGNLLLGLHGTLPGQPLGHCVAQKSPGRADHPAGQDVGRPVDAEIYPRDADGDGKKGSQRDIVGL
jgi:hypothetical protein